MMADMLSEVSDRIRGTSYEANRRVRTLLGCGVIAGPLFIIVAFVQALIRSGFDLRRHPLSLLSLGDLGWIQITNFVVVGLLFTASAVGMRRAMHAGPGRRWGPWLIGAFGVSLIAGGVFIADPAFGFPPGTPEGRPAQISWHGILHGVAFLGFFALIVACFVFARRYAAFKKRGLAAYSAASGLAVFGLTAWSNLSGDFVPLWIALVLGLGWATVSAARLMTDSA